MDDIPMPSAKARLARAVASLDAVDRDLQALEAETITHADARALVDAEEGERAERLATLIDAEAQRESRRHSLRSFRPHLEAERTRAELDCAVEAMHRINAELHTLAGEAAAHLGEFHEATARLRAAVAAMAETDAKADALQQTGLNVLSKIGDLKRRTGARDVPALGLDGAAERARDSEASFAPYVHGLAVRLRSEYEAAKAAAFDAAFAEARALL